MSDSVLYNCTLKSFAFVWDQEYIQYLKKKFIIFIFIKWY